MAGDDSNVLVANSLDSAATPATRKIISSFNYFEETRLLFNVAVEVDDSLEEFECDEERNTIAVVNQDFIKYFSN